MNKNQKHNKHVNHNRPTNHKKSSKGMGVLDHHSKQAFMGLVVVAVVALWIIHDGVGSLASKLVG